MEPDAEQFNRAKEKAHSTYIAQRDIWCPYFQARVVLNSDGFHHLQFSARRERNKREQLFKFRLLPLALEIIRKSGTIQEYRKLLTPIGKPSARGAVPMKDVEYWGLVAIVGQKQIKVRAVLRRIGTGNITFWSVMPYTKIRNGMQRMYAEGIEDE
jgi:hypothetical protein